MESVAEENGKLCRHGCGQEVRPDHEDNCPRRPYECPVPGCTYRAPISFLHFYLHLQFKHRPMLKYGADLHFSIDVNMGNRYQWMIIAFHEMFHLCIEVNYCTRGITLYVAYIGPKRKAKAYSYKVSVFSKYKSRKLVYCRDTHSDLETAISMLISQDCFFLSRKMALNFLRLKNQDCEKENLLSVSVVISKNQ